MKPARDGVKGTAVGAWVLGAEPANEASGFFVMTLDIQGYDVFENLLSHQITGPSVSCEDGLVEFIVYLAKNAGQAGLIDVLSSFVSAAEVRSFSRTLYMSVRVSQGWSFCWRFRWASSRSPRSRMICFWPSEKSGKGRDRSSESCCSEDDLPTFPRQQGTSSRERCSIGPRDKRRPRLLH